MSTGHLVACVEVGGSSVQTVLFDGSAEPTFLSGAVRPDGAALRIAVPGIIAGGRVLGASNLGWYDVDPAEALGLEGHAEVVLNDAEAAALGEAALRGATDELAYLCLGTGVGCALVCGGEVLATELLGHGHAHSDLPCPCGRTGCLETVAAGWALPADLDDAHLARIAGHLADAVVAEPLLAGARRLVLGGGIAAAHPELVDLLVAALAPTRSADRAWTVEPTAARAPAKSAAPYGLLAHRPRPTAAPAEPRLSEVHP